MVGAQGARAITGTIYDDRAALAVRSDFVATPGVTVKLYRDGGDRKPSADDASVATATTNAAGVYTFADVHDGDYWVAVDSRSIKPVEAWPEQTFGPTGSLCTRLNGSSQLAYFEGSCIGGRTAASDDSSSLATSEHVALIASSDSGKHVDFAFSHNIVTSTADGDRIQGSLRQFVTNANAVGGPSRMRFVPLVQAPEQRDRIMGLPTLWWAIVLTKPLPELTDADTVIDGAAYNLLSPASSVNAHPGRLGETATVRPVDRTVPLIDKPELEITFAGTEGIVCAARCGIRSLAMHGNGAGIIARDDTRIEHVLLGAAPDGEITFGGTIGVQVEKGVTLARHVLITTQSRAGLLVGPGARVDGERLEVNRCGELQTGGGIVLLSDGSTIKHSVISANPGAGIILGALDGSNPAHENTIDTSTISSNQAGVVFSAGSSRNAITHNDIMWNRLGGVTNAPYETNPPRENRLSANRFDENGLRPIIHNLAVENPNELLRSAGTCGLIPTAVNNGIATPRLTDVKVDMDAVAARVTIRGLACPNQTVELYQSYVTSGIRDKQPDLPRVRNERMQQETLTNQQREMALPSVGEFNYLGSTNTDPEGKFEATFPLPVVTDAAATTTTADEEVNIWASQVLTAAKPSDRAFSALAIDATGNTSEMSVRRQVD
jgi:hypothetical protein